MSSVVTVPRAPTYDPFMPTWLSPSSDMEADRLKRRTDEALKALGQPALPVRASDRRSIRVMFLPDSGLEPSVIAVETAGTTSCVHTSRLLTRVHGADKRPAIHRRFLQRNEAIDRFMEAASRSVVEQRNCCRASEPRMYRTP